MHKLDELARELVGQLDAYATNRHHSFITTQQMAREASAVITAYLAALPPEQSAAQQPATDAVRDVLAERQRQISTEGWTPEHDDTHTNGEMAAAATCYAFTAARSPHEITNRVWPWSWDWWKPADARRNCVKACALLLAEIERRDRAGKQS